MIWNEILYNQHSKTKDKYEQELIKEYWIKNNPKYTSLKELLNLSSWREKIEL